MTRQKFSLLLILKIWHKKFLRVLINSFCMKNSRISALLLSSIWESPLQPELGEYCKIFKREATVKELAELWEDVMG